MAGDPRPAAALPRRPPRPCPVCGKPASPAQRPFCSERCRQVDLGRWLSGGYAIPGDPEPDAGESSDQG